jgi:hypothetical protein
MTTKIPADRIRQIIREEAARANTRWYMNESSPLDEAFNPQDGDEARSVQAAIIEKYKDKEGWVAKDKLGCKSADRCPDGDFGPSSKRAFKDLVGKNISEFADAAAAIEAIKAATIPGAEPAAAEEPAETPAPEAEPERAVVKTAARKTVRKQGGKVWKVSWRRGNRPETQIMGKTKEIADVKVVLKNRAADLPTGLDDLTNSIEKLRTNPAGVGRRGRAFVLKPGDSGFSDFVQRVVHANISSFNLDASDPEADAGEVEVEVDADESLNESANHLWQRIIG